jgi:hypothetical protein
MLESSWGSFSEPASGAWLIDSHVVLVWAVLASTCYLGDDDAGLPVVYIVFCSAAAAVCCFDVCAASICQDTSGSAVY